MKIGDYVRTKNYGIAKITRIDPIELVAYTDNKDVVFGVDEQKCVEITGVNTPMKIVDTFYIPQDNAYILDYNSNIIDLIEIGDIITFKDDYVVYNVIALPDNEVGLDVFFLAKHYDGESEDIEVSKKEMQKYINSIVTKEQFERCEYKI